MRKMPNLVWDGKRKHTPRRFLMRNKVGMTVEPTKWLFPIPLKVVGTTSDLMSFQKIDITKEVEIPLLPHVGAFGVARRFDVHKGVDLYCPVGTPVFAVEDGTFVETKPWTGIRADCPWWEDTDAVLIEGKSGVVAYGEIEANKFEKGQKIKAGDIIGTVKRVLKKDKGRPTSMLHLQLYAHCVYGCGGVWQIGEDKPSGLLDPTKLLIEANK